MAGQTTLRRLFALALLRARDPGTLSFEENHELYRDDFDRDLRAANRAFERERAQEAPAAWRFTFGAALLIAILGVAARFEPMPADCVGWSRNGRLPTLLLGLLVGAGALLATRRLSTACER
jgi:hypothetical protein